MSNIYTILESLNKVQESAMSAVDQIMQDIGTGAIDIYDIYSNPQTSEEAYASKIVNKMVDDVSINRRLHPDDQIEEILDIVGDQIAQDYPAGAIQEVDYPFAGQAVGQKPGDQVRGTEKAVVKKSGEHPFKGRLVGAGESAMKEWKQFVAEFGANNPAQGAATTATPDPKAQAAQIAKTQQGINKLKSAGVPIANVSQAVKTVLKDPTDPKTPQTSQDKQVHQALGQEVEQLVAKGDPSSVNQLSALLRKLNTTGGAQ